MAAQRPQFDNHHPVHGGPIKPVDVTIPPQYDVTAGGIIKTPSAILPYEATSNIDEKTTNVPPVHGGPIQLPLNFRGTYGDVDNEM